MFRYLDLNIWNFLCFCDSEKKYESYNLVGYVHYIFFPIIIIKSTSKNGCYDDAKLCIYEIYYFWREKYEIEHYWLSLIGSRWMWVEEKKCWRKLCIRLV